MSDRNEENHRSRQDPLAHYFREIASLPTLTREEELRLAHLVKRGDREALDKLVEGNLRFVVTVAAKYRYSDIPLIDLINEGNIGLIKAAQKYDPEKGVKFITYAVWWIVAAVKNALARQGGVIGLPLKHPEKIYKINRKEDELIQKLGRRPTQDELAEALGLSPDEVEARLMASRTPLSLNTSFGGDPDICHLDALESDWQFDNGLVEEALREEIESLLKPLSERERDILRMRFGFNGTEPMTLREVGEVLGLSKERVRQIQDNALEQLNVFARRRGLETFLS